MTSRPRSVGGDSGSGGSGSSGTASLEVVVLAPAIMAVFMLIIAFGRFAQTEGLVDQAARDAARSATAQNSYSRVDPVLASVVADGLDTAPSSCVHSADQHVSYANTEPGSLVPVDRGDPDRLPTITVTVSCKVDFAGLGSLLGTTITRSFTSPLDDYRGYAS